MMSRPVMTSMPIRPSGGPPAPADAVAAPVADAEPLVPHTLSSEEVAEIVGTSAWWLREQARRGRLTHLRLGKGRIRFLPEHVTEVLARCTVPTVENSSPAAVPDDSVPLMSLGGTSRSQRAHRR